MSALWKDRCHPHIKHKFINAAAGESLLEVREWQGGRRFYNSKEEFAYVRCTFEDGHEVVFVDTCEYSNLGDGGSGESEICMWLSLA